MRENHRQVTKWLQNQGATHIHLERKRGKHPRLCFTFRDKSYNHTISGTTSDTYRAAYNHISQLRHAMGLVNQPKEEIVIMQPTPQPANNSAFNTPRILPATQTTRAPQKYAGTVALFGGKNNQLNIVIPNDLYREFRANNPENSRVDVEFMGDNTWRIYHSTTGHSRFVKYGPARHKCQPQHPNTKAATGTFYTTPAEFTLVDGELLGTLTEEPHRDSTKQRAVVNRKRESETQTLTAIANTTSNQATQLAALLEAIRRVEATTDYRLVRMKDNNDWAFKLNMPTIIR